jgi:uncharacterized tellurite resistance protein B-like protein
MGLREQFEKYDIITDQDIARGVVYAWTIMVVADARVEQVELNALEIFANVHNITQPFNQADWLSETVGEALNVYRTEGEETLFSIIEELLSNTCVNDKRVLLYTLMQLACVDGDFTDRELDVLNRIVELLAISRRDVLLIGILYATYKQKSS